MQHKRVMVKAKNGFLVGEKYLYDDLPHAFSVKDAIIIWFLDPREWYSKLDYEWIDMEDFKRGKVHAPVYGPEE